MGSKTRLIAITGGIGSGKSVVCRILGVLGYPIYDCDSRAKAIMDSSEEIIAAIEEICPVAICGGAIDRKALARSIFGDERLLDRVNVIVHSEVRNDLGRWAEAHGGACFVETAILYRSNLDLMVDEVWEVVAPVDIRVRRVMARSGMTENEVKARIDAQESYRPERTHGRVRQILNYGDNKVLDRVLSLLSDI